MAKTSTGTRIDESHLARLAREVPEAPSPAVQRMRRAALASFESLGIPGPRQEAWRHTNVARLGETEFRRAGAEPAVSEADVESVPVADLGFPRIVLVNGRFAASLSRLGGLPEGVRLEGLAEVLASRPEEVEPHLGRLAAFDDHAFAALNTAAFEDGAVLTVARGAVVETPIHLVHLVTASPAPTACHPRTLVVVGDQAQTTVIESFHGPDRGAYLVNALTEIAVGENAVLEHVRVQGEGAEAFHLGVVQAHLARSSRYRNHNVSFGAALARHDIGAILDGEGAEATLNGLYLGVGTQHVDNHTVLDHARPHCPSHELYKGILAGRAQAVFNGRIIVRPDAQKTDAKQSNKSMLLTNDALIHTRPQLEIYADDVKCTHGATIGHLEDEALFYLRTRGIGLAEARAILIQGFVSDILEQVPHAGVRERLEAVAVGIVARELTAARGPGGAR